MHLGYLERESLIIYRASSEVVAGGGGVFGGVIRCEGTLSGLPAGVVRWGVSDTLGEGPAKGFQGTDSLEGRLCRGVVAPGGTLSAGHVILSGASVCCIVSQVTFGRPSQLARWILALYPTR